MLKVCSSSTLAEAVKTANAYTSDQSPQSLSRPSVYLLSCSPNSPSRPAIDPLRAPPIRLNWLQLSVTPQASSNEPLTSRISNFRRLTVLARETPKAYSQTPPPSYVFFFKMCHIENIHFSCGHPEDTKYTMCELAMSEMNHVTTSTDTTRPYPCAPCFARGVEEKAKQTREQQGKR